MFHYQGDNTVVLYLDRVLAWARSEYTDAQFVGTDDLVVCLQNNLLCPTCHRLPSLRSASSTYRCGYAFIGTPCEERRCRRMPRRSFIDRPLATQL